MERTKTYFFHFLSIFHICVCSGSFCCILTCVGQRAPSDGVLQPCLHGHRLDSSAQSYSLSIPRFCSLWVSHACCCWGLRFLPLLPLDVRKLRTPLWQAAAAEAAESSEEDPEMATGRGQQSPKRSCRVSQIFFLPTLSFLGPQ